MNTEQKRLENELLKHSTDRKIDIIKNALLCKFEPPALTLPQCPIVEAEVLLKKRLSRSPVFLVGHQGIGKTTLIKKLISDLRGYDDVKKNQPAVRIPLRKVIRDRAEESGMLFKVLMEEMGLVDAINSSLVVDDLRASDQHLLSTLKLLKKEGYGPCLLVVDDTEILFQDKSSKLHREATGWCQWLLELYTEGLINLVFVSSEGLVYNELTSSK